MAVKLNTHAKDVDTTKPQFKTMLANLQANILKPHGRNFARHVFLRFKGPAPAVRAWLRTNVKPLVTVAAKQFNQPKGKDGGLVGGLFLSAKGYAFLGHPTDGFASDSFRNGMKDQRSGLFSRIADLDNEDPRPSTWEPAFRKEIHALVTLADDDERVVKKAAAQLRSKAGAAVQVLGTEVGNVLRRKKEPVEHFGYFDGISQPVFTKKDLKSATKQNPDTAAWDPGARLNLILVDDPLTDAADAFGSYLVYRKLGQNVVRFNKTVKKLAAVLGVDEELAGALTVGRFKNGTPVLLKKKPAASKFTKVNDFNFRGDRGGAACPFHAHIRKTNPRGTTPLTPLESERRRRIARRGIPYGRPMPAVADNLPADPDPTAARGLLFMCFQANVEDQFEFIQRTWVDNTHFPTAVFTLGILQTDTGDDPLIGQDRSKQQQWPKKWKDAAAGTTAFNFESAVTLKGGEYFFAPSMPFIKSI